MKHEEISMYTKKALSEALKEALKTKPFKKITVSELIESCNINRKTFYYHFEDIYALLVWTFEQEAINVVKHFDLRPRAIIETLDLRRPIYKQTAAYGHFGRNDLDLPWEKLDMVEELKKEL